VARNRLAWIGGAALGAAAVARALVRRRPAAVEPAAPVAADVRAEELRAKLAEARSVAGERDEFEAGETPVDEAEALADPDARRRSVHDAGRSAVERMRGADQAE
jgi:hypothetical protein